MLGHHPDCALRLPVPGVALQHAILEDQPAGGVRLRRLADAVVLRVNQRDVTETVLRHGDVLEVGPNILEFQCSGLATVAGSTQRKLGLLQKLTLVAVGVLVTGQLTFLFVISLWRHGQAPAAPPAQALARAAPQRPVPPPAPPRPAAVPGPAKAPDVPPPPPPVSNPAPPVASVALSNEIQQMQREIVALHRDVAALPAPVPVTNAATPPPPATNASSPAVEADDLVLVQAQRMLRKTLAHAAELDAEALDAELEIIQNMAPDFVPTYIERAQVLERRGLVPAALTQWQRVQKLAKDAGLQARADGEIERLKHAAAPPRRAAASVAPPTDAPPVAAATPRQKPSLARQPVVALAHVEQQKFMAGEKFDEMRMLRIVVAPVAGAALFNPADVEVLVTFFDRDEKNGQVAPSRAVVPGAPLRAPPAAAVGAPLEFSATYQVPRGFWQQETQHSGAAWRYYGYRVHVLYRGELHDQREQPPGQLPTD